MSLRDEVSKLKEILAKSGGVHKELDRTEGSESKWSKCCNEKSVFAFCN